MSILNTASFAPEWSANGSRLQSNSARNSGRSRRSSSSATASMTGLAPSVASISPTVSSITATINPVTFQLNSSWSGGFNAGMSITNTGGSSFQGWTLAFDSAFEITQIWNAEIVSRTGNRYVIRNAGWNGNIPQGGKVEFGFLGRPLSGNTIGTPTNYQLNGQLLPPPNGGPTPPPPPVIPALSIDNVTITEGDSGTQLMTFQATLSQATTQPISVRFATEQGTARATSDYQTTSGTLTFNPGVTRQTFTIPIVGDRTSEAQETFSVVLSNPSNVTLARTRITATINDNDAVTPPPPPPPLPSITVSDATITEGDSGTQLLTFTARLSQASSQSVTMRFATADGTARAGSDYQTSSGTLSFAPGQMQQNFSVAIVGDRQNEPQEAFSILFSNPTNATLGRSQATGTIMDNDSVAPPPPSSGQFNYGEALQKSFLFYEAQRSGDLPSNNRIEWRGDSALSDGRDVGRDLSGGYYDAGDHVKFSFPMAASMTMLSWGVVEYRDAYSRSGQLDDALSAIKWGTDYLLKSHVVENGRTKELWGQVGTGPNDHAYWGAPETMTMPRPSFKVDAQRPGSDLAAEAAAAMAAASIIFRSTDAAYADRLLSNARMLYEFADTYRGKYSDSIPQADNYYRSWSGFQDELAWGAAWLYRATGEQNYLTKAESAYQAMWFDRNGAHSWDNKSQGTAVLLAQMTTNPLYRQDAESWLDFWSRRNGSGITTTSGGLAWSMQWGSLRYAATASFIAGVYSDRVRDYNGAYDRFAEQQIDYILGNNPANRSYMVGFGTNSPLNPHHRSASGVTDAGAPGNNRHTLYGALVGGPSAPNDFAYQDSRTDYVANEVALDYNAGFTGALARMYNQFGGNPLTDAQLDALAGIQILPPPASAIV